MSIRPNYFILSLFVLKIHLIKTIQGQPPAHRAYSPEGGPAFAFPPARVWLYFIRSPEYWPALPVPRPGRDREVRPIGLNSSVENKPSLHCLVLSPGENGLGQGVMEKTNDRTSEFSSAIFILSLRDGDQYFGTLIFLFALLSGFFSRVYT